MINFILKNSKSSRNLSKLIFIFLLLSASSIIWANQKISKIEFEGNSFFTDKFLSTQINSKINNTIDFVETRKDAQRISDIYQTKGYYNVIISQPEIIPLESQKVKVIFHINEMEKIIIDTLSFHGNKYFSDQKLYKLLNIDKPSFNDFEALRNNILNIYTSRGFLFISVQFRIMKTDKYKLHIEIDEGKLCNFEKIYFRGNKITKEKTLLKISKIDRISKFTLENIEQIEMNLAQKKYIKSAKAIPLNFDELLLDIQEGRMTHFSGIFGIQNKENKSDISGFVNVDFLNIFGTDRALSIRWQQLPQDIKYITMKYHESGFWILESDIELDRQEVDSTYIKTAITSDIYYKGFKNKFGIHLASQKKIPGTSSENVITRYSNYVIGSLFHYDSSDNIYNPSKGLILDFRQNFIIKRKLSKNSQQQSTEIRLNLIKELFARNVLSLNCNSKNIYGDDVEKLDYFDMGGTFSLRGYAENQFSSKKLGYFNFEYRYLLAKESRLFLFLDSGYFETDSSYMNFDNLIGFGFGLQHRTRLGIINMSYALQFFEKQLSSFSDGFIHFGLITEF